MKSTAPNSQRPRATAPRRTARRCGWPGGHPRWRLVALVALLASLAAARPATAQDNADLVDRPISSVDVAGLSRVDEAGLRTNLRAAPGQPFDPATIRQDVNTLYRLGQFKTVTAEATLQADGTVAVRYVVQEQSLISAVQVVGNKVVTDQSLRAVIPLFANAPRDDFLVEQSIRDIKNLYRQKGFYLVEVQVDESRLQDSGILIFKIIEGPRVRVKEVAFEGNTSFDSRKLATQVKTKPYIFLFRKGQIDEDQLIDDVASLNKFYRDRGFVDVRVDRRIDLSQDSKEAKITFLIAEGRQYRVRRIEIFGFVAGAGERPLRVFAPEQLRAMLEVQPGDVYSQDLVSKSIKVIEDSYGLLGYLETKAEETSVRVGEVPEVDLLVEVREGRFTKTGLVRIQGNFLTKDSVIRRDLRFQPGRPLDAREIVDGEERLKATRLFGEPVRIAVQEPSADDASEAAAEGDDVDTRDIVVEVKERNTGSLNFGLAVGSDSGLFGEVTLRQDNFDIADPPENMSEFFAGRSFRGAGQRFQLSIAPGIDISTFSVSLADPRLFDSDLGANISSFYRFRNFDFYTENRFQADLSFALRLGDIWTATLGLRGANVKLTNIADGSPVVTYEDQGPSWLSAVSLRLQRTDIDRPLRPSQGSILGLYFEQTGALGGDYTYPMARADGTLFFPIDEDFLGRKSVLRLKGDFGYIFNDSAPLYEKFYLGGRSFRGFDYRTISPKGINALGQLTEDPVGGNWLAFVGAQYEFPLIGDFINGVLFTDTGTVTDDISFSPWRVSVGFGLRLYVPQFGPVPIAVDFGFPIVQEAGDQDQLVSFSAELPF